MDASVGHELLERETRDLAADRLVTRDHDGIRRVVDDHVDTRRELERAYVSAFATDDAPLHLVVRQGDGGDRGLGRRLGSDALDRERDDLLRLALRIATRDLTDLSHA